MTSCYDSTKHMGLLRLKLTSAASDVGLFCRARERVDMSCRRRCVAGERPPRMESLALEMVDSMREVDVCSDILINDNRYNDTYQST